MTKDKLKLDASGFDKLKISISAGLFLGTPIIAGLPPRRARNAPESPSVRQNGRQQNRENAQKQSKASEVGSSPASSLVRDKFSKSKRRVASDSSMQAQISSDDGASSEEEEKPSKKTNGKAGDKGKGDNKKATDGCDKDQAAEKKGRKDKAVVCLKKKDRLPEKHRQHTPCVKVTPVTENSDGEEAVSDASSDSPSVRVKKNAKASAKTKGKAPAQDKKKKQKKTTVVDLTLDESDENDSEDAADKASGQDMGPTEPNETEKPSETPAATENRNNQDAPAPESNAAPGNTSDTWTASQDALILSMKSGNETWAIIGQAVGRGKKEVQKRHKELTSANAPPMPAPPEPTPSQHTPTQQAQQPEPHSPNVGSGHETALNQHSLAFRQLYGVDRSPRQGLDDRHFGARDYDTLAMLAARQKANRWLELQAAFFNLTGRMVSIEVLKHKMAELSDGE